jgi:hypothetical protein
MTLAHCDFELHGRGVAEAQSLALRQGKTIGNAEAYQ